MAFHARTTLARDSSRRQASSRLHLASRQRLACAVFLLVLTFHVLVSPWDRTLRAQPPQAANSDELSRRDAIRAIPFDRLNEESQTRLWAVVSQPSIYRRLPVSVIESDPDLYLFLVRYPEVVVNMWELMGVTKVQVRRTGEFTFDATDGSGTTGRAELVFGDRDTQVLFAEGAYEGPLFRRLVQGRCVLVLKSDYHATTDRHVYVTSRLDLFVQLDNMGADLLAKTLQPVVGKTADHNFVESTRFLGQVSQAAETKPAKLQQMAARLNRVMPEVRQQFVFLTGLVSQRATAQEARQQLDTTDFTPAAGLPTPQLSVRLSDASQASVEPSTPRRRPLRLRR